MKQQSQKLALCGMTAALGTVLMVLGAALGIGMYLAPMLAGLCLLPAGRTWGVKYQLLLWVAVSLLSLMLVADPEQNLMFIGLFGWYPALRPKLQHFPRILRCCVKLMLFNAVILMLEALIMLVLVPEAMETGAMLLLLLLGNITFLLYDLAIPRTESILRRYLKKFFPK